MIPVITTPTMQTAVVIMLWLIGALTAYPKNKRWHLKEAGSSKWTKGDALMCLYTCFFFWTIVWIDYLCKKWDIYQWLSEPSKF
jgi:hypothetical protein